MKLSGLEMMLVRATKGFVVWSPILCPPRELQGPKPERNKRACVELRTVERGRERERPKERFTVPSDTLLEQRGMGRSMYVKGVDPNSRDFSQQLSVWR